MVAHQINSDEWTGSEDLPAAPAPKSRFEKLGDRHPVLKLCAVMVLLAVLGALDVRDPSLVDFGRRAFFGVADLVVGWSLFFGGLTLMYWVIARSSLVNHITVMQRRYLVVLAFASLVLAVVAGNFLAGGLIRILGRVI